MAARDHRKEAERQDYADQARRVWFRLRVEAIHEMVSAFDVLRRNGVELKQTADNRGEQIQCPFHGRDQKPSAKVHPAEATAPSHVWCYVCRQQWDAISLWRKFNGGEEKPFGQVLSEIESAYGIKTPEIPEDAIFDSPRTDTALEEFLVLFEVCDSRLRDSKPAYQHLGDRNAFFAAGSVLDKVHHQVTSRKMPTSKGLEILRQVLNKIGEKERACPVG